LSTRVELSIGERKLKSGLTLLAVQNPGVATYAAGVMLDVDMKDEQVGEEGLANLLGDMLDEGTKKRSGLALAEAVEGIGGSLDGSPSGGAVQCPVESAPKALALLVEMITSPSVPPRELARVKQEIASEILSDEDDPRSVASERFRRLVYGSHPYARPARGTRKGLAKFTAGDVRRFHDKWFVPHGGYVAAAGPDPIEKILDQLEHAFRSFRGQETKHVAPDAPGLPAKRSNDHIAMPREQVHVFLGHVGIKRVDPDYYALSVMDHILGTGPGFTSRISKKLRDEQGLCYSVGAAITSSAGEEPGTFSAYIGTSPEHRQKAVDGFLHEMERMRTTLPSEQELGDVKDYLTGSFVFGLERNANLARYALRAKRFELGFDYVHRYPGLIRAVTRDDVRTVAEKHLHPDRVVIVSAGAG